MWPIGYGQIQTSCHAGGMLSLPMRSSTSGYSNPLPRLRRWRPGPVQSARFKRAMESESAQAGLSSHCMPASLDGLDRAQQSAVAHRGGPLLVLGGPGSGKSHVIAHRTAWLVEEGSAADSVLVLAPTPD